MDIKYLIENKKDILKLKKSTIKRFIEPVGVVKSDIEIVQKSDYEDTEDVINRNIIGNTYNWLDNHGDVHVSKCFAHSISKTTPFFLADHKQEITARLGKVNRVEELSYSWEQLGIDKEGSTESLTANVDVIKAYNESAYTQYKEGVINQHSVGMQYVLIDIAINDSYDKEGYANWGQYLPMLGNPEKAEEQGFFYIIKEAKLFEISAVLNGSNTLTPTLQSDIEKIYSKFGSIDKFYELCKITLDKEPLITPKTEADKPKKNFYKHLIKK